MGSHEEFREAWQLQVVGDRSLSAGTLRVAIVISCHMNRKEGGLAWPGFGTIRRKSNMSRSAVIRATKKLEAAGHLTINRQKDHGRNAANRYQPRLFDGRTLSCADTRAHVPEHADTSKMTLGSVTATTLGGSVTATTPEPLISKPLREPIERLFVSGESRKAVHNGFASLSETLKKGLGEKEKDASCVVT